MSDLRARLTEYVARVRQLHEHVVGNEQATKQALITPLFSILGYDTTDPRECLPEFKVDFGKDRSTKPIDWAFSVNGRYAFFVEAKEVGKKLGPYTEQLADYFAKEPAVTLGILTNGVQWRFYTDAEFTHIMDREPFVKWNVLTDDNPPLDLLTVLQKSQFSPDLIRTLAHRTRARNLLVSEINRLLEPSPEFIRLAIANIETRKFTETVIDSWKPVLAHAIVEWAKQKSLNAALTAPPPAEVPLPSPNAVEPKIVTTAEELAFFEKVKTILGPSRPVAYTDRSTYFTIHIPQETVQKRMRSHVVCRLYTHLRLPLVWFPVPIAKIESHLAKFPKTTFPQAGWVCIQLNSFDDTDSLGDILRITYDHQNTTSDDTGEDESDPPVLRMA